mmetsp:Transcript_27057/g.62376  ORF Transcript_27057/g.62376 Transcript_27057/m.62376 type:complete len:637 (-) Transcript_27057:89-1999(-)
MHFVKAELIGSVVTLDLGHQVLEDLDDGIKLRVGAAHLSNDAGQGRVGGVQTRQDALEVRGLELDVSGGRRSLDVVGLVDLLHQPLEESNVLVALALLLLVELSLGSMLLAESSELALPLLHALGELLDGLAHLGLTVAPGLHGCAADLKVGLADGGAVLAQGQHGGLGLLAVSHELGLELLQELEHTRLAVDLNKLAVLLRGGLEKGQEVLDGDLALFLDILDVVELAEHDANSADDGELLLAGGVVVLAALVEGLDLSLAGGGRWEALAGLADAVVTVGAAGHADTLAALANVTAGARKERATDALVANLLVVVGAADAGGHTVIVLILDVASDADTALLGVASLSTLGALLGDAQTVLAIEATEHAGRRTAPVLARLLASGILVHTNLHDTLVRATSARWDVQRDLSGRSNLDVEAGTLARLLPHTMGVPPTTAQGVGHATLALFTHLHPKKESVAVTRGPATTRSTENVAALSRERKFNALGGRATVGLGIHRVVGLELESLARTLARLHSMGITVLLSDILCCFGLNRAVLDLSLDISLGLLSLRLSLGLSLSLGLLRLLRLLGLLNIGLGLLSLGGLGLFLRFVLSLFLEVFRFLWDIITQVIDLLQVGLLRLNVIRRCTHDIIEIVVKA